jgi:hypothetical protein
VRFHVRDDLCVDGRIDPLRLRPLGRMAGHTYVRARELVELTDGGPRWSPEQKPAVDRRAQERGRV